MVIVSFRLRVRLIFPIWLICLVWVCACGNDEDKVESNPHSKAQIAFVSNRDGDEQIYIMNADGTNQIKLTDRHNQAASPSVGAFNHLSIFTPSATHGEFNLQPAWSPDGAKIAFVSTRDGNNEIYVMNADGTNPMNLTHHPASELYPAWSPDGTKIAFVSGRDGNAEIYVMNADGTNPVNLTNHPANDTTPSWSPN
ncbi:PD40 domain-containing protein [Candidatus Poribacteria bacterium]|nr:PD40 domain-containing protein [Candidatus Poribacteria bacterium]